MSDVTVSDLRSKVDSWLMVRKQIKDLEAQISELNKLQEPIARELIEIMDALEINKFEGLDGKIQLLEINYVNNPQTEEDKAAFYNHLKAEGLFEEMVSVHHGKLNSYYKNLLEEAMEQGMELNIPGLEPKQRKEIRKSR